MLRFPQPIEDKTLWGLELTKKKKKKICQINIKL